MKSIYVIFLTLLSSALNSVYSILNTRFLGLEGIGTYSILTQTINTIVQLSDLGLSTGFLKFYSLAYKKDSVESKKVIVNTFYIKVLISFSIILVLFLFSPLIMKGFLKESTGYKELILAYTTIFTISISELLMSRYRAEEKFKKFFIFRFLFAFFRLIPMIVFYSMGKYSLDNAIYIFIFSTLGIVIVLFLDQKELFDKINFDKKFIKELVHFSKWIFVSNIAQAFMLNAFIELYFLKAYSSNLELGYFSSLLSFFMVVTVLNTSITTLFFQKFAACEDNKSLKNVLKKSFKTCFLLSLPLLLLIPFGNIVIKILLGQKFLVISPMFGMLMFTFFFELLFQSFRLVLYIRGNKKIAFINGIQFVSSIILGYILIVVLNKGAYGALISIFTVRVFGGIYMWYSVVKTLKEEK